MSRTIEGCLNRFFYHPTKNYVHFMIEGDNKAYKMFLPSHLRDISMVELSKPGDMIKVIASEPNLAEMESTISSWENLRLSFMFKNGY